jgi:hypothetical protein
MPTVVFVVRDHLDDCLPRLERLFEIQNVSPYDMDMMIALQTQQLTVRIR